MIRDRFVDCHFFLLVENKRTAYLSVSLSSIIFFFVSVRHAALELVTFFTKNKIILFFFDCGMAFVLNRNFLWVQRTSRKYMNVRFTNATHLHTSNILLFVSWIKWTMRIYYNKKWADTLDSITIIISIALRRSNNTDEHTQYTWFALAYNSLHVCNTTTTTTTVPTVDINYPDEWRDT